MSMVEYYNQMFRRNIIGIVTGTFGINQFPNIPSVLVKLKARSSNPGSFFIGTQSGTVLGMPFELNAGDSTDWFAIDNLNKLWHGGSSGTSDILAYWVQR